MVLLHAQKVSSHSLQSDDFLIITKTAISRSKNLNIILYHLPLPFLPRFSLLYVNCIFSFSSSSSTNNASRKGFLCKFVLKSPSFFAPDISYMKISPRNVLTFIIKNNFMCFAKEIYRKVNVLKFSPHSFLSRLDHSLVEKYIFYVLWCVSFDTASHSDPYGSIESIHIKMKCLIPKRNCRYRHRRKTTQ